MFHRKRQIAGRKPSLRRRCNDKRGNFSAANVSVEPIKYCSKEDKTFFIQLLPAKRISSLNVIMISIKDYCLKLAILKRSNSSHLQEAKCMKVRQATIVLCRSFRPSRRRCRGLNLQVIFSQASSFPPFPRDSRGRARREGRRRAAGRA